MKPSRRSLVLLALVLLPQGCADASTPPERFGITSVFATLGAAPADEVVALAFDLVDVQLLRSRRVIAEGFVPRPRRVAFSRTGEAARIVGLQVPLAGLYDAIRFVYDPDSVHIETTGGVAIEPSSPFSRFDVPFDVPLECWSCDDTGGCVGNGLRASVELDLDASVVARRGTLSFRPRVTSRPVPTRDELEVASLSARLEGFFAKEVFLLLFDVPGDGAELGRALGRVDAGTVFVDTDGSPLANLAAFASAAGDGRFLAEGRLAGFGGSSDFGLLLDRLDLSVTGPGASGSSVTTTTTFHEDGLEVIQYREARSRER
jgi:hypothetical protein